MKHIKIYFTILAGVLSLITFLSSCDKDKVDPPMQTVEIDTVYSLRQMIDLVAPGESYTFEENAAVYAVITMDESQGNIYKQLYVQDYTDAILLIFNDKTNLKVGDSVRINLKGTTLEISHNAYQLSTLSASKNMTILARGRFIEPQPATLEQINSGLFTSKLVKVEGVEFREEEGVVWSDYLTFNTLKSLLNLFDCHGQTLKVLTSGHAAFASQPLPKGNGSMVVIASIYDSDMQLLVRDIYEVDMQGTRCDGTGGDEITILSETFETGQGDFTVFNKTGAKIWKYNADETAMQIGIYNDASETNEDWLISPAMDFSEITTEATLTFQHAIVKTLGTAIPSEYMKIHQTVWFSFDYTSGDPNNASWTQIPLSDNDYPEAKNWIPATTSLDLPNSVLGQKRVHVAYKYTCDDTDAAVWRIHDVLINSVFTK